MVSYAQNQEDVVLWRALKNIRNGFYIDVGANDPVIDSVTKWFYDSGWSGINIEPVETYYNRLKKQRSRDVNLQCIATDRGGTNVLFYEVESTGLSTTRKDYIDGIKARGLTVTEKCVNTTTLNDICDRYCDGKEIQFLKVDVEGSEEATLKGINLQRYRPWVILVENTDWTSWEKYVLDNEYQFVLFDGLNRFYVSYEKAESLGKKLGVPANVTDGYRRGNETLSFTDSDSEHIAENCYKYILGRNPESRKALEGCAKALEKYGFEAVRKTFITSAEFQEQYKNLENRSD